MDTPCPLVLVEYIPDLLAEEHGFGGFLFGTDSMPVVQDGSAWLYTTTLAQGAWESWVRPLDLATLQAGAARRVLQPDADEESAVLHHVIAVADDLLVGIYCDGAGMAAATATAPDRPFVRDPGFRMRPQAGWETPGGEGDGWTLESNGAHVVIGESDSSLDFWQGYDSYRARDYAGELGWFHVSVDKMTRRVRAMERHPGNPIAFRRPEWSCARCGSQLGSDVRVAGKRAFFYYMRPSMTQALIGMSLSHDPLFMEDVEHHILGTTLGEEAVAEKFQALRQGEDILLFHESRFNDGSWRTGMRRYRPRTP